MERERYTDRERERESRERESREIESIGRDSRVKSE